MNRSRKDEDFVPITEWLRRIEPEAELPALIPVARRKPRPTVRPLRIPGEDSSA